MRRAHSKGAEKNLATTPYDDEDLESLRRTLYEKPSAFPERNDYLRVLREFVAAAHAELRGDREQMARIKALLRFAAAGFDLFLARRAKTLDHAFRVRRSRGAPARPEKANFRFKLAYMVDVEMNRGASLKEASDTVALWHGRKSSYAKKAYVEHAQLFRPKRKSR
jgi:hypothetical protein